MWWSMWCSSLEQPELYATVSLTLRAHDLHVEVGEAAGRGQGQFDHALHGDGVAVQVVEQRAVLVVVGHQPQLSPRPVIYTNTHTRTHKGLDKTRTFRRGLWRGGGREVIVGGYLWSDPFTFPNTHHAHIESRSVLLPCSSTSVCVLVKAVRLRGDVCLAFKVNCYSPTLSTRLTIHRKLLHCSSASWLGCN